MQVIVIFAVLMALAAIATCVPIARTIARTTRARDLELESPAYGTAGGSNANVVWLENYRRARGVYLRKKGRTLLANREYQPLLHKGLA